MRRGTSCVAVIGTGSAGMRHLGIIQQLNEGRPIAVPVRPDRIGQLESLGYCAVEDLDKAVEMGASLCIIATDTGRHVKDGLLAIQRGLDLLVEKPLSVDAQGARQLVSKASEAGRRLFVGCVLRFSDSLNKFRDALARVGRLHAVRIECQSYLPDWRPYRPYHESYSARAEEGGVLRDLVHEIDYAGAIFGWPKAVQARVRNLGRLGIKADEVADLLWETEDGCLVSLSLDYLSRLPRRRVRAAGEWGTLEWDGIENTVTVSLAGRPVEVVESSQTRDEMFLEQARAFVHASQGVWDPRLATGEEGVKALAVCDAARQASDSRRQERVEYL